jgi:cytochrome c oxidase subunit II
MVMSVACLPAFGVVYAHSLSIFDPASSSTEAIRSVAILVMVISAGIFLIVEGVLAYSIIRFRIKGTRPPTEPAQVYGSKPIEIAWTAAPALIVFVLILVAARTLWEVERDVPAPKVTDHALFVTVIGRQWWWEYRYTHYNGRELHFITANELHVPASELHVPPTPADVARPVYLTLESADVCHSYWVPRLAGKVDLIPGRTNHLWFQSAKPDLYLGQCAEYCGTQHAGMLLRVYVDPPDEFDRWLAHQEKPADQLKDASLLKDQKVFLSQSCVNCHRVAGTLAQGSYAPDLTHLMSRQTLASGLYPNTPGNLRKWVHDPQKLKPGCLMPAFGLSAPEQDQIVRYLESLH